MDALRIRGGKRLKGEWTVQNAKNAALPIMAGAILTEGKTFLRDCPQLSDISDMGEILRTLGCGVHRNDGTLELDPGGLCGYEMPEELSKRIRSSIFLLGPILARFRRANVSLPGGCEIGLRPIDLHVKGMEALGANVQSIAFNELYLSLKQGVVDGQENPLSVIYFNKYYETQKYLAMTNHVYNSMNLVISKKVWDKLPEEYQQIIIEESKNAAQTMREAIKSSDADYISKLEAEGMTVTYPDTAEFAAAVQPAYDKIADYIGENGQEYIDTFLKMVDDCRNN